MMHGPEKSDSAIVVGKSTNKAERSAAELVEQRTGPRGMRANEARWTLSQISVSQVLARIRQRSASIPEVGAVCGKAACTDPRRGARGNSRPYREDTNCCNA
jgi:hypothetical protein